MFFFSTKYQSWCANSHTSVRKKKHSTALGGRAEGGEGGVFCDKLIFIANPDFFLYIYPLLLAYLDVAVEVPSCSSYVTTLLAGFYETGEGGGHDKLCIQIHLRIVLSNP